MSAIIPLEDVPKENHETIIKSLHIKPKEEKTFYKVKKYQKVEDPVRMFEICVEDGKKMIRLPYRFACCMFNKLLNNEKFYPKMSNSELEFKGTLLDRQEEPAKEALLHLKTYNTCSLALYPGFGKTFLGAYLAHKTKKITLVLFNLSLLVDQWYGTFVRTIPEAKIWVVGEPKTKYPYRPNFEDLDNDYPSVIICMEERTDKIPLKLRKMVGTLIIDEAHLLCSKTRVKPLLAFSPKYIIVETATPESPLYDMMLSISGSHMIKRVSSKQYHCFIINTKIKIDHDKEKGQFTSLVTNQCENEERNMLILDLISQNLDREPMIATPRVGHCKLLAKLLNEIGVPTSELHSKLKSYTTKKVLVGSTSKMGVGFDEQNFCKDFVAPSNLMIITTTSKSWGPFEQIRGRGMRASSPIVVYLNDRNSIVNRHMSQMRKWVEETNGILHEIAYTKGEKYNFANLIEESEKEVKTSILSEIIS